jgi:hypothetical protein
MKTKLLSLLVILIIAFIISIISLNQQINPDGYYYRYDDGYDKLIKITDDVGKLYNVNPEGEATETQINVKVTSDNEIFLYSKAQSFYFVLVGDELISGTTDIIYKRISEEKFNKYLEDDE